VDKEFSYMSVQ